MLHCPRTMADDPQFIYLTTHYLHLLFNFAGHTAAFRTFLQQEFSEENMNFWFDCEVFKRLKTSSKLKKWAIHVREKYIDENAPEQVNEHYFALLKR